MSKTRLLLLSEAAEKLRVSTTTLRRWESLGKISLVRTPGGQRRVPIEEIERLSKPSASESVTRCCIYIRVKSNKEIEKGVLASKQQRLTWEAVKLGYKVTHSVIEIGSYVKKVRPQLQKLLNLISENQFDVLLIYDKEIFLPFVFEYFEQLIILRGIKVIVLNPENFSIKAKEHSLDLLRYLLKISSLLGINKEKQILLKETLSKSIKLLS